MYFCWLLHNSPQCVKYEKPLLESGTMGTSGNVGTTPCSCIKTYNSKSTVYVIWSVLFYYTIQTQYVLSKLARIEMAAMQRREVSETHVMSVRIANTVNFLYGYGQVVCQCVPCAISRTLRSTASSGPG